MVGHRRWWGAIIGVSVACGAAVLYPFLRTLIQRQTWIGHRAETQFSWMMRGEDSLPDGWSLLRVSSEDAAMHPSYWAEFTIPKSDIKEARVKMVSRLLGGKLPADSVDVTQTRNVDPPS